MTAKTNKLSGFKIAMWLIVLFYVTLIGLGVQHLFTGEELRSEWLLVCLGFIWMIADSCKRRGAMNEQD